MRRQRTYFTPVCVTTSNTPMIAMATIEPRIVNCTRGRRMARPSISLVAGSLEPPKYIGADPSSACPFHLWITVDTCPQDRGPSVKPQQWITGGAYLNRGRRG